MVQKVKKRDGRVVDFDATLISNAIRKAMKEVGEVDESLANSIAKQVQAHGNDTLDVDSIQVMVENALMQSSLPDVARAYIIYRHKRDKARNSKSNEIISDIIAAKKNDITRENANMNADTPAGMMMKVASERTKEYVDEFLLSDDVRKLVDDNILHVHDKDYYPTKSLTCLQSPVDKLLQGGFRAGHGESRPAKRIETASILTCISLESTQNEQHGGQAIPALDFYLAPFVRKTYIEEVQKVEKFLGKDFSGLYNKDIEDYLKKDLDSLTGESKVYQQAINQTVERVHQSMEAFIHNMNTIHCVDGDELVWVFDECDGRFKAITIREISDTFRPRRYKVLSIDKNGQSQWKYIYDASFQGKKDVYAVKGECGRIVNVTDNHRIATIDDNRQIKFDFPDKIKNIVVPKFNIDTLYQIGYKWDLTKYSSRKKQNYVLPYIPVSLELCELMGYYVADGCVVANSQLAFSVCEEDEMVERLIYLMQKVYGKNVTYNLTTYSKPKKISQIRFNVGKVWTLNWQDICGHNASDKKVPFFVLGGTDMMQRAFLRGYLQCDGSVKHGEGYYNASSISNELICGLDFMYLQRSEFQYRNIRVMRGYYDKTQIGNTSYEISFCGNSNKRMKLGLDVFSEKEYPKYNKVLSNSNYFVEDLDTVELSKSNVDVYDIAVEDNENFVTASNVVIHNSRGGNQVVFSSVNYGTDTSAEGRCIIRELLKSTYEGVGNGATAIFPIQIWKKKRGVSFLPGDKNYDLFKLACKVTAKRFFPNFVNLDAPYNQSDKWRADDPKRYMYEVATMGCRTRVFEDRFGDSQSVGRGNLSFSTVNLPGLALSVMDIEDKDKRLLKFFEKLTYSIDITGKQLYERYQFQCTALAKQFPLLMSGMWVGSENLKPDDEVREVLKHGTLGVGFIGLAECLIALCGHHHGESEEAQELGLKIITFMRDKTKILSDKYDLNYSVFATPAEGLSGKFTKKDRKKYGIVKGVTDKDYYTNSNHVPVYYHCSAEHKAKVEAPYHDLTRGGHIFYVELDGDATHNVKAVEQIVGLMDKYNIGYGSINHNRNRCLDCSYEDASADLKVCPVCGSKNIDKLQRITGYLVGTTDRWNSGKLAELHDRVTHGV